MHLDKRAQTLLKALVERYIADGQPVGSRELSKISGLELSPATIRNVMSDLEEMGFVASPHTSAGRIPTPRGYRVFVDQLLTVQEIDESLLQNALGQSAQSSIITGSPQKSSPMRRKFCPRFRSCRRSDECPTRVDFQTSRVLAFV